MPMLAQHGKAKGWRKEGKETVISYCNAMKTRKANVSCSASLVLRSEIGHQTGTLLAIATSMPGPQLAG